MFTGCNAGGCHRHFPLEAFVNVKSKVCNHGMTDAAKDHSSTG